MEEMELKPQKKEIPASLVTANIFRRTAGLPRSHRIPCGPRSPFPEKQPPPADGWQIRELFAPQIQGFWAPPVRELSALQVRELSAPLVQKVSILRALFLLNPTSHPLPMQKRWSRMLNWRLFFPRPFRT